MKCGTTTIYDMLARTPGVGMCRSKEPNHFCADLYDCHDAPVHTRSGVRGNGWVRDSDDYLQLYSHARGARWLGEASNTYLYSAVAAERIAKFNPDAHIVVALRSPVERAYSEYRMQAAIGRTSLSFSDAIREDYGRVLSGRLQAFERYVSTGLYAAQIERYLRLFPRERILIEIVDRPGFGFADVSRNLGAFLGCDVPGPRRLNAGKTARFPKLNWVLAASRLRYPLSSAVPNRMKPFLRRRYYRAGQGSAINDADRVFLETIFRDDVARLSSLIGEDLSFWLRPPSLP
jgi:hypothetical protein